MNTNLNGKNALVCGSSKGLGKASAIALAELGANVILMSRSADMLMDAVNDLQLVEGQHHSFIVADSSDHVELQRKIKTLTAARPISPGMACTTSKAWCGPKHWLAPWPR